VGFFPHKAHDDREDALSVAVADFGLASAPKQVQQQKIDFYG